ncbi:Major histocompatibility complex class I-related protein, partial [Ophiophagus hannah]
ALVGLRVNSGGAVSAEPPVVTVTRRTEVEDGMETHICRQHGFYPREIDASWTRDGEIWLQDTFHGSVVPNMDGTYHYWLSVQIDPKERDRYRCHVEHDGLQEPLDVALKEPKSNLGIIISCIVAALVLVSVIAGILVFFSKYRFFSRRDIKMATKKHQVSDLSFLQVISNLEQGPEAPSLEFVFVLVCVCLNTKESHEAAELRYLPLPPKNGKMGPIFITARLFLGVETPKEELLQVTKDPAVQTRRDKLFRCLQVPGSGGTCLRIAAKDGSALCAPLAPGVGGGGPAGKLLRHSRKLESRVSWMEKVEKEDPNYWVRNTQMARDTEEASRGDLETLRLRYNQSKSLHTWQRMYGCELRGDGSRGGFDQYGYDGRTFLTFDKEILTWVAPDPQAQISKRKWDASAVYNWRGKSYLEETCIKWLKKHLCYGEETLLRRGEHLDPDWTFFLYGWISLTHSAPLGPWSAVCPAQRLL